MSERMGLTRRAALLASLLPSASWATAEALRGRIDDVIRPLLAEHDLPGMAVAVTVAGQATHLNYGVAARQSGEPVSETTLFELGSVSKIFTATLALYAQATGKLAMTDHPGRYLPQLQRRPIDQASLLLLGTYTAGGLPLQFPNGVTDDADALAYFRAWRPRFAPGTQRAYSNPSIGLLGLATASALGRDFADALDDDLLPQLGLQHTHVHLPPAALARYAWGENAQGLPVRVKPGALTAPAYGLKASAADLIQFVQLNIDPSRLSAPLGRAVAGTQVGHFEVGPMVQGLGWEHYPWPSPLERVLAGNAPGFIFDSNPARPLQRSPAGARLFNKTGSTAGFGAYVAFVPEQRIGVVLLANRNYPIPARVTAAFEILSGLGGR